MNKIFGFIVIVFMLGFRLFSCVLPEDEVLNSLGKYDSREFYTQGEFQDYTDYAKYYFTSVSLDNNGYFTQIQAKDLEIINEHLDDFESWIETYRDNDPNWEIVVNYDFDRSLIDSEDYFYIYSETHTWDDGDTVLANYDIYFFDTQTKILYYFHNNI